MLRTYVYKRTYVLLKYDPSLKLPLCYDPLVSWIVLRGNKVPLTRGCGPPHSVNSVGHINVKSTCCVENVPEDYPAICIEVACVEVEEYLLYVRCNCHFLSPEFK